MAISAGMLDSFVSPLFGRSSKFGVVLGVLDHKSASVYSYDHTGRTDGAELNENTIFEIGSLTKVFTSALLASMVEDKLVFLDQPVCTIALPLSTLPAEITLVRLATHTSGLPHIPANLIWSVLRNWNNPYSAYTIDDLMKCLRKFRSQRNLRTLGRTHYSNLGMGLLGFTLAYRLGTSYEQAVVRRVCDAFHLSDTLISLNAEQKARFAPPYSASDSPAHCWDMPALAGAGALKSTVKSLMSFLNAHLDEERSPLNRALRDCQVLRTSWTATQKRTPFWCGRRSTTERASNYTQGVGLGWMIGRLSSSDNSFCWHNGATGGYSSFAGFVPDTGRGVVLLSNRGIGSSNTLFPAASIDEVGFGILETLNMQPVLGALP